MLVVYGIVLGVTSPWWVPNQILERDYPSGTASQRRFADYPYANKGRGFLLEPPYLLAGAEGLRPNEDSEVERPRVVQKVASQVGVETGIGLDDGVMRFGVRGRVQFPSRLQLDADWSLLREHDQQAVDVVLMGREHLSIRFAESARVQFYSGAGVQHFCDLRGCVHGIDVTYGFEAFPGKPLTMGLEGSIGNLDRAFAPGIRGRMGVMFGPIEASLGWHQRWVGSVPLGGPFVGIGGWF